MEDEEGEQAMDQKNQEFRSVTRREKEQREQPEEVVNNFIKPAVRAPGRMKPFRWGD